jgi:hypothetical protein
MQCERDFALALGFQCRCGFVDLIGSLEGVLRDIDNGDGIDRLSTSSRKFVLCLELIWFGVCPGVVSLSGDRMPRLESKRIPHCAGGASSK